jgi:hypothetical protein
MAITTSNSINVNARRAFRDIDGQGELGDFIRGKNDAHWLAAECSGTTEIQRLSSDRVDPRV